MNETAQNGYRFAQDDISQQIIGILQLCGQLCADIPAALKAGNYELLQQLVADLEAGLLVVGDTAEKRERKLKESHVLDMLYNVSQSVEEFLELVNGGMPDRAADLAACQLAPFIEELLEDYYFWSCVFPNGHMDEYYREEFAPHHRGTPTPAEEEDGTEISIFIPAYNKLEFTKQCVESVLKYTDFKKHRCRLYLINHGSTDETQQYFESVEGARIMRVHKNVRMIMFSAIFRVVRGPYAVFVSNDTIVTKNWLDNLLLCVSSSPNTISATPVTPNISNLQAIPEEYNSLDEMQAFAQKYNISDSKKWERRTRILPVISLYNTALVRSVGFADRLFKTMEFWDDDFSLRARRAGYIQYLCKDAYCHHYGSVTGREAQVMESTLEKGRDIFYQKNHVDAWSTGFCYDPVMANVASLALESPPHPKDINILGVDAGFGGTPLQLGNIIKNAGIPYTVYNITSQPEFEGDLRASGDELLLAGGSVSTELAHAFGGTTFHFVCIPKLLEDYPDWRELLAALHARMAPGGTLLCTLKNPFSFGNAKQLQTLAYPYRQERISYLDIRAACTYAHTLFSRSKIYEMNHQSSEMDAYIAAIYPEIPEERREHVRSVLMIQGYVLHLIK